MKLCIKAVGLWSAEIVPAGILGYGLIHSSFINYVPLDHGALVAKKALAQLCAPLQSQARRITLWF